MLRTRIATIETRTTRIKQIFADFYKPMLRTLKKILGIEAFQTMPFSLRENSIRLNPLYPRHPRSNYVQACVIGVINLKF